MAKGMTMVLFGLVVWARAIWVVQAGITPEPLIMGAVGLLALAANLGVAVMLFRFREGDSDMRSVWLCSRNDGCLRYQYGLARSDCRGDYGNARHHRRHQRGAPCAQ